jgi:hypothetical protein
MRSSFHRTPLRQKSGLNVHHGHWGFLLAFISMNMLIFGNHGCLSIGLTGLGWGLMLDEIIPMLKMPSTDRILELEVYGRSLKGTTLLLMVIVIISSALFIAFH